MYPAAAGAAIRGLSMHPALILSACALVLSLSGCASFPRGAGLTSEILAASATDAAPGTDQPAEAGFSVEPVTRARLAALSHWQGPTGLPWLSRMPQQGARTIAPGDKITLTLWNAEDNSLLAAPGQRSAGLGEIIVPESGKVFLPWLGALPLAGLSPDAARSRIEERYLEVMPSAQVQLQLQEGRQNSVSLVSGMARPGTYPLDGRDITLLQILAEGGGAAAGLNNPQVRLHRNGRVHGISLERLAADPALDTTLAGGDRILVIPDDRAFLSLGATGQQARHLFPHDEVSALDALAVIGGLAETRADARGVMILRRYPEQALRMDGSGPGHERVIFTIDLTSADGLFSAGQFRIADDDLVYVTESPMVGTRNLFALAGSIFGLRNQALDN